MLIRDIMIKKVISVTPDISIEAVAKLLIENRIHSVPVIENGKPVGIITETDFFTKGAMTIYLPDYINLLKRDALLGKISSTEKKKIESLMQMTAKDIMSSPCVTISKDADIADFFSLVQDKKMISVPVVDGNKNLMGIITLSDIIHLINIDTR